MPPPSLHATFDTQEVQAAGGTVSTYLGGTLPVAFDSRKAKPTQVRRDIAVDVREFRSSLPSILHQGGMRLAPVTLTVGDFVLSSVHCVERKSISDLFGSFASGRLYTQAEAMCKHYKCPCLLIEFDPNKSFSLQNVNELGGDIRVDSIGSKLALLCMHFPKLRILWSKSPHETLRLFRGLKAHHDEVNVEEAVEVGRHDDDDSQRNEVAWNMLLRLPGVTETIARKIASQVENLAALSQMSRDELRTLAGAAVGQKLFTFFRQSV